MIERIDSLSFSQETNQPSVTELPQVGKVIEMDGKSYVWTKQETGEEEYDPGIGTRGPIYHTLRSWFSHTSYAGRSQKAINGPGWDRRLSLQSLSPEEMLARYGRVFTHDEIHAPAGEEDWETGEITGGMPDDILYLELEPLEQEQ